MSDNLHPNNKHRMGYDLDALCITYPDLSPFVFINKFESRTIDFANPKAVKALNTALLYEHYDISFWEFPDDNLCPPIPGRVDYIHHLSDLIAASKVNGKVKVLDIGTGASCIYPLLGQKVYGWDFLGTDVDKNSLKCAQEIINNNGGSSNISLKYQVNNKHVLEGILDGSDKFMASMCNPPFYKSEQEALHATNKKLRGLNKGNSKPIRNFSGKHNELWYQGGEKAFLHTYIYESSLFKESCIWFTSLVSKKDLIRGLKVSLKKLGVKSVKVIPMGQGNKISRIIAWSFLE